MQVSLCVSRLMILKREKMRMLLQTGREIRGGGHLSITHLRRENSRTISPDSNSFFYTQSSYLLSTQKLKLTEISLQVYVMFLNLCNHISICKTDSAKKDSKLAWQKQLC